jgi:hypothetical protein
MKLLWTLLFALLTVPAPAQINFTGLWTGILTQDEGGYRSEYSFELYLIQEGDQLHGRSYVSVDDIQAVLDIKGTVIDEKIVRFEETRFVRFTELKDMEWCYKKGLLTLKRHKDGWRLEGPWVGTTSFGPCIPGKIIIQLIKPQA